MNIEFCTDCGVSFKDGEERHAVREGGNICGNCVDRRRSGGRPAVPAVPTVDDAEAVNGYETIPWYRQNWFALLSFLFIAPVFALIAFTGDIYYKKRGKVVRNHPGIRIAAGILAVFMTIGAAVSDGRGFRLGNALSLFDFSSQRRGSSSSSASERTASSPRILTVSPVVLVDAYIQNEIAADQRYKGKQLRVSGAIEDIGRDLLNNAYITFPSSDELRGVQVFFEKELEGRVAGLRRGQSVTIVGECGGLMMNVLISDAHFE